MAVGEAPGSRSAPDRISPLPHALQNIDIHLSRQVFCVKAVDHLDARSGVSRKGQQAHILALDEAEHDRRMPERIQGTGFA